jgi:hypothetical protein
VEPAQLAVAFALGCVVAAMLVVALARRLDRRRRRRRARRAFAGESASEVLLAEAGFEVLERQVGGTLTLWVDGEAEAFALRADYLVRRDGDHYIAEVKTGERGTRLGHAATRRQLIEYMLAYEVEGVLLVDADSGEITGVTLDPPR